MLRLPPFEYRRPASVAEAAAILAGETRPDGTENDEDAVRLVAGGTDLWPNLKRRHQKARTVVSLMAIPGLAGVTPGAAGELRIGATTLLADLEREPQLRHRFPALATAVASISSPPLRNMGTIGGNLCLDTRCTYYNQTEEWRRAISYCLKEGGTTCWVAPGSRTCLAHAASDAAPMLCALGARARLVSAQGERTIPLPELYRKDGIRYLTKGADELLTEILLPAESDAQTCRTAFWKLRRRGSIDFAVLSVAVALWTDAAGAVTRAKIVLGAVASSPVDATAAADVLLGAPPAADTIAKAAALARKAATPFDNPDFQAQWRAVMVERYTAAALAEAAGLDVDPSRLAPKHVRLDA